MSNYITVEDFKSRHGITTATNEPRISNHVAAASLEVDSMCNRQFGQHVGAATARYFYPYAWDAVRIDDAYEITGVDYDADDSGTYATALVAADYTTKPTNGVGPNRQTGWPVETIRLVTSGLTLPRLRRPSVKVTAKWGWAATPTDVIEATYLLAHRLYYEVAVPSGITSANAEFGLPGSPLQRPYTVERLLKDYVRGDNKIGVTG